MKSRASVLGSCCLFVLGVVFDAPAAGAPPVSLTIRADWFDRGNVKFSSPDDPDPYDPAPRYPQIWSAGPGPHVAEYDVDFPVTAEYTFVALYAAATSRPVEIHLDGQRVHQGFAGVTGSWKTERAKWERQCTMQIARGKHTIKLVSGCLPNICGFRLESPVAFPEGWKLDRPIVERRIEETRQRVRKKEQEAKQSTKEGFVCNYPVEPPPVYDYFQPFDRLPPPVPRAHRILEFMLMGEGKYQVEAEVLKADETDTAARCNELLRETRTHQTEKIPWVARLSVKVDAKRTETETLDLSPSHLRKMLRHTVELIDDFRTQEDVAGDLLQAERSHVLKQLAELDRLLQEPDDKAKWERFYRAYVAAYRLKNRVALSNPLIDFDALLFARRLTYNTSHLICTYYDGQRYKAGGGIFVLRPVRPDGELTNLTGELNGDALYRDPDLSFDAKRVLFSYNPDRKSPCRIYEVGIDGKGLRRVTDSEYDDIDPCYLPDGKKIMFVSTRCRRVTLCHNVMQVSVLHTMNRDGSEIRCVSPNTIHDFKPSVMPNGQIAFTRWEYVDKHLANVQSLWTCNPDGTRMTHVAGNHFGPLVWWEPFRIPGSRQFVCVLGPHMPMGCGPVALVDPIHTSASPAIFENITPEIPPPTHFGFLRDDVGYYTYAYPLSEKYFVVSYCYGPDAKDPTGYGLYLLDRWNNRDLIRREADFSCFEPIPVRARPAPPSVAPYQPEEGDRRQTGTMFVTNVYRGLQGVARGEVKYLRITEEIPKPVSADCTGYVLQYPVVSKLGHLAVKRLWGTVPVEPDGSAHFRVPAGKAVYFSALDENFMEIQRMRSFTSVGLGERVGCVGCHEPKHTAPDNRTALAVSRPPSEIAPPPHGGVHAPDFYYDVQPVLDRHCSKCHTGAEPKGGVDLSGEYTNLFNVAFETLVDKELVNFAKPRSCATLPYRHPKYYGSHASKLIRVLLSTHREEGRVEMPPEDFRRLVTWIDCNCPYYGTYTFNRPGTSGGRELFVGHREGLKDVYQRRCRSCHDKFEPYVCRIRLPEVRKSRALLAPLSKAAGGEEGCKQAVFAGTDDPDFQKLLGILSTIKAEAEANPRADMLTERPPLLDPNCRYVVRP